MRYRNCFHLAASCLSLATGLFVSALFISKASAETWADATGKFKLEAEYAGIDGKSIVLRKADGKTVKVPIANLSPESRAQAKALYQKSKAAGGTNVKPVPMKANGSAEVEYKPKKRELNFTPPAVAPLSAMPTFPENASLQETLDFVRAQVLAGHLEVLWFALPQDIRESADRSDLREGLRPVIKANLESTHGMVAIVDKISELLISKKAFILKSPILAQAPPEALPLIEAGYDPATGIVFEYSELAYNSDAIADTSLTNFLTYHLPRIGAHVQALVNLVPAPVRDMYLSGIVADQTSDTAGTISWPKQDGTTESTEMVLYNGRWIPSDLAERWQASKETFVQDMIASATANQNVANNNPQMKEMYESISKQVNAVLDPLLAAKTQQEFDFALGQVMMPLMMAFGGGAGPGGFNAPEAPGAPAPGGFAPPQ